jgi:hypothetical protein
MEPLQKWTSQLESQSISQQITALREIARSREIRGIAIAVVQLAGSSDDEVRDWAAACLESTITPAAEDASDLIDLLQRADNGDVCYWTATLLGRLGENLAVNPKVAAEAVRALETCLRDSRYLPARERAAWGLRQLGTASKAALPTLRRLSSEAPPRLKRLSDEAIKAIDAAA